MESIPKIADFPSNCKKRGKLKYEIVAEVYELFKNAIAKNTFETMLLYFETDKTKIQNILVDLMTLYFINKGIDKNCFSLLRKKMHCKKRLRCSTERINYLNYYKETTCQKK